MAILINEVRKSFNGKEILKGINFDFEDNCVNMIIGASGSGKTVLLRCMVGLIKPDSGRVLYDGMEISSLSYKRYRVLHQRIGMLFQSAALFDSLNVEENVSFPLKLYTNWNKKKISERVGFCLERVNLSNAEKLYPSELSGGMKKRVGIARAIALNPKYLYCDEPNSGLDPKTAAIIDELILDITREFRTTTIVVSHDMKSMLSIADKIMFIYKGAKEWEGAREDIATAQNEILLDFIRTSGLLAE